MDIYNAGSAGKIKPTLAPTPTPTPAPTPTATPLPTPTVPGLTPDCVSNPNPVFTAHFTDVEKITSIIPPMTVSGNRIKGHAYVGIGTDQNNQVYDVPVYAPVDSRLITIGYFVEGEPVPPTEIGEVREYELEFEASCEVVYKYAHIRSLAPRIAAYAPSEPGAYLTLETPLPVTAGEVVAYTTGTVQAHNWDFLVKNSSKHNQFTNQQRYEQELRHLVSATCAFDYYPAEMRSAYYPLLVGDFTGTIEEPDCLILQEKPGTISGGWFHEPFSATAPFGTSTSWAVSIGMWENVIRVTSGVSHVWTYPEQTTYIDPRTVTSEHCYEHPGLPPERFVYLQLLSSTELAVAFGEGGCPLQLPAEYQVYYR